MHILFLICVAAKAPAKTAVQSFQLQNEVCNGTTECDTDDEFNALAPNNDSAQLSLDVGQINEIEEIDDGPEKEVICQVEPSAKSTTKCSEANDANTPLEVPKREPEPISSLNSKSTTILLHQKNQKASATCNKKIHLQSICSNHIKDQSETTTLLKMRTENSAASRHSTTQSTADTNRLPKRNFGNVTRTKPQSSLKPIVACPDDSIARNRTKRRAAPTDLRDPCELLKKQYKIRC